MILADGKNECPVCHRKYAHEEGCRVETMHNVLDLLIVQTLSAGDCSIENLRVYLTIEGAHD